jgi:hypothetical protein
MIPLLAALLIGQLMEPDGAFLPGRTAIVFSTAGHSEWCPAGNVTLDLGTGRYTLTVTAPRRLCGRPDLERPIRTGRLDAAPLATIRSAYRLAAKEGLDGCDNGSPTTIIVSNGGTPVVVLTSGAGTMAAPDDLSCWSGSAHALHRALEDAFSSFRQR